MEWQRITTKGHKGQLCYSTIFIVIPHLRTEMKRAT